MGQSDILRTMLNLVGAARVILCGHGLQQATTLIPGIASLPVLALDRDTALTLMERQASKTKTRAPILAGQIEYFNRLYNQLGGNPRALQTALAMRRRYQPGAISTALMQSAWESAPRPARLIWLTLALFDSRTRPEKWIARVLPDLDKITLQDNLDALIESAVLDVSVAPAIPENTFMLSALGRAFANVILSDPTSGEIARQAIRAAADFLAVQPNIGSVCRLLKAVLTANIPADLALDMAYTFAPVMRRAGAWSAWTNYLERLYPAASGNQRLWIGLQLGIARRWLAQWHVSSYLLANVIEEAGRSGAFDMQADAMVELAITYRYQDHDEHAASAELLRRADDFYCRVGMADGQQRVAVERIQIALNANAVVSAQQLLEDAFAQTENTYGYLPDTSPRLLILAATLTLRAGSPHEALRYAERALPLVRRDRPRFARLSAILGQIYFQLGQPSQAINHLTGALDMMQQRHDVLGQARVRMNLGALYLARGNVAKTLDYFHDLPAELERLGDVESLRATLKNLEVLNRVALERKTHTDF